MDMIVVTSRLTTQLMLPYLQTPSCLLLKAELNGSIIYILKSSACVLSKEAGVRMKKKNCRKINPIKL